MNVQCFVKKPIFLEVRKLSIITQKVNFEQKDARLIHSSGQPFSQLYLSKTSIQRGASFLFTYICITIQQQFIFPITHSIHTRSIHTLTTCLVFLWQFF